MKKNTEQESQLNNNKIKREFKILIKHIVSNFRLTNFKNQANRKVTSEKC